MADPLAIVGGVASILQIITSVTKLAKNLNEVRESYDNVALNITLVTSKLSTIRLALEALHSWRASDTVETEASMQLDKDLGLSLSCCAILITVIDGKLAESGYTPGLKVKHKIKYLWLEDILKEYVSNLEGQVQALQLLLTIFQCRTATEQKQALAKRESRSIIEQVRAETMTLGVGETDLDDAISILSHDPSVHLDVESIIMKSPAYRRVYGERESPRRRKASGPPPPPPPRRKPIPKLPPSSPGSIAHSISASPPTKTTPQPPSVAASELSPPPPEIAPQPPPVPPRPKARNHRHKSELQTRSPTVPGSQGRINVWDFLGPDQEGEVHDAATMVMADSAPVFELPADQELTTLKRESDPGPKIALENFLETDRIAKAAQNQSQSEDPQLPEPTVILSKIDDASSTNDKIPSPVGLTKSKKGNGTFVPPTQLEGFKNQLDLAFEDSAPTIGVGNGLSLSLSPHGSGNTSSTDEGILPASKEQETLRELERESHDEGKPVESSQHENGAETTQVIPRALSIHSSVDMYDASVRNMPIGDSSRPASSRSMNEDEGIKAPSIVPVDDDLEAEMEGLSVLNQQLAAKHDDTEAVNRSSPRSLDRNDIASQILTNTEEPDKNTEKELKPISTSLQGMAPSPQITMTPSRDEDDGPNVAAVSLFPKESNALGSPLRAPPPPPALNPSIPPIPVSSPLLFDQTSRDSGVETSTISSRRDSSVFEASSTISSSERSLDNTISTLQKSTSNTTATSFGIHGPTAAREQAQADLRRLQSELTAAKGRGDSQAAQQSLQKSIDVIRRTYLAASTPLETKKPQKLRDRASFIRFPSLSSSSNGSALGDAAAAGNLGVVRAFLDAKVNVDARGGNYQTPLMQAALNGRVQCLDLLKQRGADEFAVDLKGRNVLHLAIASNRLPIVQWLLNAYPPPRPQQLKHRPSILSKATDTLMSRTPKNLRETSDSEGSKPLHVSVGLEQGDIMKALLAAGVDIESRNNWSHTSLHQAIISNRPGSFGILLEKDANINAVDAKSMTPLHWATKTGHVNMVEILLKRGASRLEYDTDGNQPVHQAAWVGQSRCIEALVAKERQNLDVRTKAGESLLHIACLNKNSELAAYLLSKGMDVNSWAEPQATLLKGLLNFKVPLTSLTPLHYACCKGDYEMTILLLDHEAWVNAATPEGVTALMMATETEETNIVNLLLTRGAKVNASMPGTLTTALHIAARHGDLETVQQLCRSNANTSARTHGGGGNYGRTPGEEATAKCADKVKRVAVEGYFRTIRENRFRNSRITTSNARQSYETVGQANRTGPSYNIRPSQPISYVPWDQQNAVALQGAQYGYQSSWAATYPVYNQPVQTLPEQWYDPNPLTHVESPPPYQAGSSVPARLASQAPVHRPGDMTGPRYS